MLTKRLKEILAVALADKKAAKELADKIAELEARIAALEAAS